jgi:predicted tellurium resistance membrane protein TerC
MSEFLAFNWVNDPQIWLSLVTLTALEIVLGIDNLVFIAILTNRLPEHERPLARKLGLGLALGTRLLLLATLAWIVSLTQPLFSAFGQSVSWRDLILIGGGLFLIYKATHEIHNSVEGDEDGDSIEAKVAATFAMTVVQIGLIDIIFSLDSVITAVGMANQLWVMVLAVVLSMILMLVASTPLANFVSNHPTVKMLALAFLVLIGVVLIADGLGFKIPKGYIYFAMAFSVGVESLNFIMRKRRKRKVVAA